MDYVLRFNTKIKLKITHISEINQLCNEGSVRTLKLQSHRVIADIWKNTLLNHITTLEKIEKYINRSYLKINYVFN